MQARQGAAIKRLERTGWSITRQVSECVLNMACERPPRLRRFGGFAIFSYWRSHPSSGRRGISHLKTVSLGREFQADRIETKAGAEQMLVQRRALFLQQFDFFGSYAAIDLLQFSK